MDDELIQQAVAAGKAGQKLQARKLLVQALKQDEQCARAWYLLSQVVEAPEQAVECLEKVLQLQPGNPQALQRLQRLRAAPATSQPEMTPSQATPPAAAPAAEVPFNYGVKEPPVEAKAAAGSGSFLSLSMILLGFGLFLCVFASGAGLLWLLGSGKAEVREVQQTPGSVVRKAGPVAARVGALAPDFNLPNAYNGETLTLSKLTGLPVMINFWASWCGFCIREMPDIQQVYNLYLPQGLVVVAVSVEDSREEVLQMGSDLGVSFPLILDRDGKVARTYRVNAFPTSYFIKPDGEIAEIVTGAMSAAEIEQSVLKILP
ncbi:MAG: redoxin domain-containing protein [Chloroflexota bacterium]